MPIYVYNCNTNAPITNATFSAPTYNEGGGNYYMYVDAGENISVGAPGYGTVFGNTDDYSSMYARLCPYKPPPPPPPTCGCWS